MKVLDLSKQAVENTHLIYDQTEVFNFGVKAAEFREYYYGYGTTQILRFDFPSTWFNY